MDNVLELPFNCLDRVPSTTKINKIVAFVSPGYNGLILWIFIKKKYV